MKVLYTLLKGENGQEELREYDVDDDAVPLGICAGCPKCGGPWHINAIDYSSKTFTCQAIVYGQGLEAGWVSVQGPTHCLPEKTAHFDGRTMVIEHPYER